MTAPLELITVGRISVDLYADAPGRRVRRAAALREVDRRHGHQRRRRRRPARPARRGVHQGRRRPASADYVRAKLAGFGVDTRFVGTDPRLRTPLAFAALTPPEDPELLFYREPAAPDMQLTPDDVDVDEVRSARRVLGGRLVDGRGAGPLDGRRAAGGTRPRRATPSSTSTTAPTLWADAADARRLIGAAIDAATVAIGNRAECEVAVGTADPDEAAGRLLERGRGDRRRQARRRRCARGDRARRRPSCRRGRWRWSAGSGPATRSAAPSSTGCWRAGRRSGRSPTPTPPARSSPSRLMCADAMPTDVRDRRADGARVGDACRTQQFRDLIDVRVYDPDRIAEALAARTAGPR